MVEPTARGQHKGRQKGRTRGPGDTQPSLQGSQDPQGREALRGKFPPCLKLSLRVTESALLHTGAASWRLAPPVALLSPLKPSGALRAAWRNIQMCALLPLSGARAALSDELVPMGDCQTGSDAIRFISWSADPPTWGAGFVAWTFQGGAGASEQRRRLEDERGTPS